MFCVKTQRVFYEEDTLQYRMLLLGKRKVKNYAGKKKKSTDRTGRQAGGQENGPGR